MPDLPPHHAALPPIFLSYASEDAAAARRIAEALGQAGLVVWFDQSELRGGDAWDQRIRRQIKECALFMPVISAHTQARAEGYFRLEWHLAEQRSYLMAHSKAFIVPVVVDDTLDANALVPDRFRERQWTRLPEGHVPFDFAPRIAQLLGGTHSTPRRVQSESRVVAPPAASERSVAIMAFANLSDDRENEYFSEGVSDELLTVLQNVPGLRVAARTSAFSFKGKQASVREIGSLLDVAHLVEGGVQKVGNRVKVAARLTNVTTGIVTWSRSYTREIKDAFALQEELALAIVGELRGQLEGNEAALVQQANRGGTRVPAAYESYLLGKYLYEQHSAAAIAQAVVHLRAATELDPKFALAWIGLASAQLWRCSYLGGITREEFDRFLADARHAVEWGLKLEPDLGAGLGVRGFIECVYDFDFETASATLRRAEQLAPNDRDVLFLSAQLAVLVHSEAEVLEQNFRVVARDPLNARPHYTLARSLAVAGRFDEARAEAARFQELTPNSILANVAVAFILAIEGRFAEAERAMQPSADRWPNLWLGSIIFHGLGEKAASDAALKELIADFGDTAAAQIACIHAFRGEPELAFSWLETARQQRDAGLISMFREPLLRKLTGDSRWVSFWRAIGITVAI